MTSLLILKSMLLANALQKTKDIKIKKKAKIKTKLIKCKRRNMCRTCDAEKGIIPIFNNIVHPNLSQDIHHFSGVMVENTDRLPKHMCQNCLDLLNGCIMFREMCQKSNKKIVEFVIKKETNVEANEYSINDASTVNSSNDVNTLNSTGYSSNIVNTVNSDNDVNTINSTYAGYSSNSLNTVNSSNDMNIVNSSNDMNTVNSNNDVNTLNSTEYSSNIVNNSNIVNIVNSSNDVNTEFSSSDVNTEFSSTDVTTMNSTHAEYLGIVQPAECDSSYNIPSPTCSEEFLEISCVYCEKDFINMRDYNIHILNFHCKETFHKQPKERYLCEVCGKTTSTRPTLLAHKTTHENVFPFKCEKCPYRGRTMDLLKVHKRSHLAEAEKPYRCTQCPKSTTSASNLNKHMRHVHSSNRPHKCNYCEKMFSYQHDMKRHIKDIHLRQGTVECNLCFKKFNTKKILRGHQFKVHKIKAERHGRTPAYLLCRVDEPSEPGNENEAYDTIVELS